MLARTEMMARLYRGSFGDLLPTISKLFELKLLYLLCRLPTGLLSALQTDENHVGQGYAALVTKYLSKQIAESGFDVCAGIFEKNYVSRSLFEKLGFKSIGEINQIGTKHIWNEADE